MGKVPRGLAAGWVTGRRSVRVDRVKGKLVLLRPSDQDPIKPGRAVSLKMEGDRPIRGNGGRGAKIELAAVGRYDGDGIACSFSKEVERYGDGLPNSELDRVEEAVMTFATFRLAGAVIDDDLQGLLAFRLKPAKGRFSASVGSAKTDYAEDRGEET